MAKHYNDYNQILKNKFGDRVQKITLDMGFTCPNRDGSKGIGGCTYCNNVSFSPGLIHQKKSMDEQLEKGISFFSKKYSTQNYLAYFQSYTNTYADVDVLYDLYKYALNYKNIKGVVIGTRPDCIPNNVIDMLSELAKKHYVAVEIGIESTLDRTLNTINRCHDYAATVDAFTRLENKGLELGGHLIINLPGETREEMLEHSKKISNLPINSLKLHHLQIIKYTAMAKQYKDDPSQFNLMDINSYIQFISEFITYLRPDIAIERLISEAPSKLLLAPDWGIKNFEFIGKLDKYLEEKNLRQGQCFH